MRIFMIISLAAASFATASQADGHMGDLQVQPLLRSSETLLGTEFSYPEGKALITSALATLPAGESFQSIFIQVQCMFTFWRE